MTIKQQQNSRTNGKQYDPLPIAEAARLLGVSTATVRNWTRAGHLTPASSRPLVFDKGGVEELQDRIRNNRFNRLRKRANKTASEKHHRPDIISAQMRHGRPEQRQSAADRL